MDTRHLKIFTTVYKTRSFTKAAQVLFTSQPTISEHMRNLESSLGCKLFDRLGRSILPTPEADLLYPKAIAILDEMDKIQDTLATASSAVSGQLLLGASTIPGAYILPQHAAAFKHHHPDIAYQIEIADSSNIVQKIAANELYLGVVGASMTNPRVEFTPLGGDQLVLAVSPALELPDEIEPEELYALDFLLREQGSGTRKSVEEIFGNLDLSSSKLKVRATLGSSTAVKEAIKAGLGVSIISRIAIRDELRFGLLREIRLKGLAMQRSFYLALPGRRTIPNHYRVFADFLQDRQSGACTPSS